MVGTYPMTPAGKKKLEEELTYLKENRQKKINDEIKYLGGFCGISDDFAFGETLDQQSLVKERIRMIEEMLSHADLIEPEEGKPSVVMIGSTVTFKELPNGEPETYTIVGTVDANPIENKISLESPIGKSLLGFKEGDEVFVQIPDGEMKVKILAVK